MKTKMTREKEPLLVFPVLSISDDNSISVYTSLQELQECPKGAEGFYNNLKIISSDGFEYIVKGAKRIGNAGKIDGLGFLRFFGLYNIVVRLSFFDERRFLKTENFKSDLLARLYADEELWNADGRLEMLNSLVKRANSIAKIIELMKNKSLNEDF